MSVFDSFLDELEKISATVLMKQLSPAAKKLMERMTGFAHGASVPQVASARRLKGALTGAGTPQLMTEMHGMGGLLSAGERRAKSQAKQHFEGVLAQQGKVYKGVPGMEQQIGAIGGHPAHITRTPARVVPGEMGTAAARPRLMPATAPTMMAPVNPYGQTFMAPAGVL